MADTQVFPDFITKFDKNGRPMDEPRRLHGLRFPVLPAGSWFAQVGGGAAALAGSWMQFGTSVTLMVAGVASVVLGTLREAGKV